nr:lactate utilization protein [bacterium]
MQQVQESLRANGFDAKHFDTLQQAAAAVLEDIPDGGTVGFGGSMTLAQSGLYPRLLARGNPVTWHWEAPLQQRAAVNRLSFQAPYYLSSANAVTREGGLFWIDGNGNRVGTMLYGRGECFILCGKNKLAGTLEEAVLRTKRYACPPNAKRLGLSTPCARTGQCQDCHHPQRFCNAYVYLCRPTVGRHIHVYLFDEEAGY